MNMNEIADKLIKECETNPISSAVFHVLALRQRARGTVALTALYYRMKKEGFNYNRTDYVPFLQFLAALNLGSLVLDRKGNVTGLKDVKITLQSIGSIACKQKVQPRTFKSRPIFRPLRATVLTTVPVHQDEETTLTLEFHMNGKSLQIPIPKDLTPDEISLLINRLH